MARSPLAQIVPFLLVLFVVVVVAQGVPTEPTPEAGFRPLPDDYVKTWYIYNDRNTNGILDPGDERIAEFRNWWTTLSAHTQHNYRQRSHAVGEDWASAPFNGASATNPDDNYWLPRKKNAIQFYMTYSQFDNNDWYGGYDYGGKTGDVLAILKQRNEFRNGWALGWLTHDLDPENTQTLAGKVEMDVFAHNARAVTAPVNVPEWGPTWSTSSYCNPQVSVSNDISEKAEDTVAAVKQWHPPQFDDATGDYSWAANATRMIANGLNAADLTQIVNSMEVREHDPDLLGSGDVIWPSRRPSEIEAGLTDHADNPYLYEDAFKDRSFYHDGANDGGVLAGLAGQDSYDPELNNWGDQQVIRIDISPDTLASGDPATYGNITQVIFYDFGLPGTGDQVNPDEILLDLLAMVWDPGAGEMVPLFPEQRFYIAAVPEPTTLSVFFLGAVAVLLRRSR